MDDGKTIVIKVGTNVLTNESGAVDTDIISNLVGEIAELKNQGYTVVLISSGAVGAGKAMMKVEDEDVTLRRQVYSAIGQIELMNIYSSDFKRHGLHCAQVLATREDFNGKEHYKNMKNCFHGLLKSNVVPIVNENDVVSLTELMFTDNDQLAGLTAFMVNADTLFILTNVDGVYEKDSVNVVQTIAAGESAEKYLRKEQTKGGRGGMESKIKVAEQCSRKGIDVYIANGKKKGIVSELLKGLNAGTHFTATN